MSQSSAGGLHQHYVRYVVPTGMHLDFIKMTISDSYTEMGTDIKHNTGPVASSYELCSQPFDRLLRYLVIISKTSGDIHKMMLLVLLNRWSKAKGNAAKQRVLPYPVGSETKTSLNSINLSNASSCLGLSPV